MPNFDTSSVLNAETISRIQRKLTPLDVMSPVVVGKGSEDLNAYWKTYGFNSIAKNVDYCLGTIDVKNQKVATHVWLQHGETESGEELPYAGTIFIFHGLFDHVGLFLDLIDHLVRNGYSVVAAEFPGHGLSDGESAVIHDFNQYAEVVGAVASELDQTLLGPFYALGQSTGCAAIMQRVLDKGPGCFEKLVFLAPLLRPTSWFWVNKGHSVMRLFKKSVPRKFTINTHREDFCEFLEKTDPLQPRNISMAWVGAMKKWVKQFQYFSPVDIPLKIFQGNNDATVDWEYNIPTICEKFVKGELIMVDGGMHHLANEGDQWRTPVFDGVVKFLKR